MHKDIVRPNVLVDKTALVQSAHCAGNTDRQPKEFLYRQRAIEQPAEQLAARVFEHERGPPLIAKQGNWLRRPIPIELRPQDMLALESSQYFVAWLW
jgi:hypothetical protein